MSAQPERKKVLMKGYVTSFSEVVFIDKVIKRSHPGRLSTDCPAMFTVLDKALKVGVMVAQLVQPGGIEREFGGS